MGLGSGSGLAWGVGSGCRAAYVAVEGGGFYYMVHSIVHYTVHYMVHYRAAYVAVEGGGFARCAARVPHTRHRRGETREQRGGVGLGELEHVPRQNLRHTSHLGGVWAVCEEGRGVCGEGCGEGRGGW